MLRALTLSVFIRRSRSGSVGNQRKWDCRPSAIMGHIGAREIRGGEKLG